MLAAHACLNSDECLNGDTAHVRLVPKSRVLVIMLYAFSFQGNKTVVTCWERADLLALVCGVFCEFVTFPLVSWVRCGT